MVQGTFQVEKQPRNIWRHLMNLKLDKEEIEMLNAYENEAWVSISNHSEISKYKAAAKSTF